MIIEIIHGVVAVCSLFAAVYAYKAKQMATETHLSVNSRMDELLKLTQKASHAEGVKEQKDREAL